MPSGAAHSHAADLLEPDAPVQLKSHEVRPADGGAPNVDILTLTIQCVTMPIMPAPLTGKFVADRRARILSAARWCFLNFGFTKTSIADIAKRAGISRTLLYRTFKDKEDIFTAVFADWLVARHPAALQASTGSGSPCQRLLTVCTVMVVEPWSDMVGAPMGGEFFDVCERIDPDIEALHHEVLRQCVGAILGDESSAEVFLLALDGLLADQPTVPVLEQRTKILVECFVKPKNANRRAGRA